LKRFFLIILILGSLKLNAQFKPFVSTAKPFVLETGTEFLSYSNEWNDFLLFGRDEHTEKVYSLLMTDENDELVITSNIRVATQVEDNHFSLAGLALAGRNLTAFVESRNFKTGRNVMAMQAVDNKGGLTSEGMLVGYFDFAKAEQPGTWHISSSPDQKSIALIAQLPHVPNAADKFMYFFINENLTITHKGEFSAGGVNDKPLKLKQFLTSDKGELYLIAEGVKGKGHFPIVYKANLSGDLAAELPVGLSGGQYQSGSYKGNINPEGELVLAGYLENGNPLKPCGTWSFNSSGPQIRINLFEKTLKFSGADQNFEVLNVLFNKETYFLVGKSKNQIHVNGFDTNGSRKFDILLNADLNTSSGMASGILQDQLCLLYNQPSLSATAISNNGIVSSPEKYTSLSDKAVYPQFFIANENHIAVISKTGEEVSVITFR